MIDAGLFRDVVVEQLLEQICVEAVALVLLARVDVEIEPIPIPR